MILSRLISVCLILFSVTTSLPTIVYAKAPNEIFTNEANKIIYDSCKNALDNNISEEEFQKTACYAHIAGALNMFVVFGLNLVAGKDTHAMKQIEEDIKKIFCNFNGYSVRDLAAKYVIIHDELNKYAVEKKYKGYGSFAVLMNQKQFCKYFIEDNK